MDLAFANVESLPCDGVQYAVREPGVSAYTAVGGPAVIIEKGDQTQTQLKVSKGNTTSNTLTDTWGVSAKLAGKLVPASKLWEVGVDGNYSFSQSVSTSSSETFNVEITKTINPTGKSQITATPVFYKMQVAGFYWKSEASNSCVAAVTPNLLTMDTVAAMGWQIRCDDGSGSRRCVAGEDYRVTSQADAPEDVADALTPELHLPAPAYPQITYKTLTQECRMKVLGTTTYGCQVRIPSVCEFSTYDNGGAMSFDYVGWVKCPVTLAYKYWMLVTARYEHSGDDPFPDDGWSYQATNFSNCASDNQWCALVQRRADNGADEAGNIAHWAFAGSFWSSRTMLVPVRSGRSYWDQPWPLTASQAEKGVDQ